MIKYLVLSDIHLGNKRNKTEEIIRNLDTFFENYGPGTTYVDLDIIFIAGDLFDRLLDMNDDDTHLIKLWLDRLTRFCERYDIIFRVLKGTPSHDWNQSSQLETIWAISKTSANVKYVSTLSIEHIEELGLHVLYVPDEWSSSTEETLKQVKSLMASMQIKKVSIAIMHGLFNYQLPGIGSGHIKHDETSYLDIVEHFINIGHIHTHSTYERILAQGSFDRLRHNEEEPKGAMLMILDPSAGNRYFFIENKAAKIFKTITLKNQDVAKSLEYIDKQLSKVPQDSYIKIKAPKNHGLYLGFDELKIKFPLFNFSKGSLEEEEETAYNSRVNDMLDVAYASVQIDKENISALLWKEMLVKHRMTAEQHVIFTNVMETTLAMKK